MRVILAAGGSGGHIFPSLALARELEKYGVVDIRFVSSKRKLDRDLLAGVREKCSFLSINPMPLKFRPWKILVFAGKLLYDILSAAYILLTYRPDVVVGFGGYSSGAITALAGSFGIPVIIHEQNVLPGRANRMLAGISRKIAVSFEQTGEYFPGHEGKVVHTGNPLRVDMLTNDRNSSAVNLGVDPDKKTILVMGGSQGSTFLNSIVSESAIMINKGASDKVQFIHLTGVKDYEAISRFYRENDIVARVFSFIDRIDDAYAASDIAISRSGAAAVFELAYYAKPMILVPYPNPKNNQRTNAAYFAKNNAAVYREENGLTSDILASEVLKMLGDSSYRHELASCARRLSRPDAAKRLAEEVIKLGDR